MSLAIVPKPCNDKMRDKKYQQQHPQQHQQKENISTGAKSTTKPILSSETAITSDLMVANTSQKNIQN